MNGNREGGKQSFNREQEISTISRSLKQLAKELNVPVIALSQLSRAVEQRGGSKRPQLSDLRESGSIEQDADQVLFIHRPEYYQAETFEDGSPTAGKAEIIIAKNRHGQISNVRLNWVSNFSKFTDEDDRYENSNVINATSAFSKRANLEDNRDGSVNISSRMNDDDYEELNQAKNKLNDLGSTGETAPF
jgi:replicative DNA helicase